MKTILTEAKRVGLNVFSIKPAAITQSDYYEEHPFDLGFRGVYVQLVVFLEHLSSLQNIARVDSLEIHPVGNSASKYVELEGTVQIKTYKYLGTKADTVLKAGAATPPGMGGPGGKPASSEAGNAAGAPATKGGQ
jgi:Tfp pilus assembly protein PilO